MNVYERPEVEREIPQTAQSKRFHWIYVLWLVVQPVIAVVLIVGTIFGLGVAQKYGYFEFKKVESEAAVDDDTEYFCPMLCVPPVGVPGRCPVCDMDLKPRKKIDNTKDFYGLTVNPASRRLSNIQTVTAIRMPVSKPIGALGEIRYDETSMATISAYIGGRVEKLFTDFTGARVKKNQPLGVLYSPDLFTSQAEWIEVNQTDRLGGTDKQFIESTRQRLIELGIPEIELGEILRKGKADSRVRILSPIEGTVVKKIANEGQYVKTGSPLFQVADLSKVWLKLKLFPEDASRVRYGQDVELTIRSLAGKKFFGRVAFIDPVIDPRTQTVGVRVVVPNEHQLIRVGDYAKAVVQIPLDGEGENAVEVYNPLLAGKWISPKHPYIVMDKPGNCPESGEKLIPAKELGFVDYQPKKHGVVVVPRRCVLVSGDVSIAYVETKAGRFEFRRLITGATVGENIAVLKGIKAGENVVSSAAFMIDSAFNMAGKPSLIDPNKTPPKKAKSSEAKPIKLVSLNLEKLSAADRDAVAKQKICPVTDATLGSMGTPIKVGVEGRDVFICCEGCRKKLTEDPNKYFAILDQKNSLKIEKPDAELQAEIDKQMEKLDPKDRQAALEQIMCPITDMHLGSMGIPLKVDVEGQEVFICCEGCRKRLLKDPKPNLGKIAAYRKYFHSNSGSSQKPAGGSDSAPKSESKSEELPQMELPQMELPEEELPQMELPTLELQGNTDGTKAKEADKLKTTSGGGRE